MIYIDTNVIIYSYVNIGDQKQIKSSELTAKLIADNNILTSPLVIEELIFVFNKLKLSKDEISNIIKLFIKFSPNHITNQLVLEAYDLCFETNRLRCINDAIHLKFAEQYGSKLITFDRDFKKFRPYANIEIEILD
jgi:predicted nucleic acid-binding protein